MPNIDEGGEFDIYEGVMGVIPVRIDRGTVHLAFVSKACLRSGCVLSKAADCVESCFRLKRLSFGNIGNIKV